MVITRFLCFSFVSCSLLFCDNWKFPMLAMIVMFLALMNAQLLLQILVNALIVVKDLQAQPGQYSPTLLLAAIMQVSKAPFHALPSSICSFFLLFFCALSFVFLFLSCCLKVFSSISSFPSVVFQSLCIIIALFTFFPSICFPFFLWSECFSPSFSLLFFLFFISYSVASVLLLSLCDLLCSALLPDHSLNNGCFLVIAGDGVCHSGTA